ncbi:MAG: hypothetical protein KAH72_09435 [Flavobacteriaceae bacterium]|nr:hypothetical protein [Flavobacteriaceae bacterium]
MRLMLVMLLSLTILCSKDISEKLIVSSDKNSTATQMHLLKLKMVFIGNSQTRALQEKYKLNLEIETLDEYTMVVVKPINSLALKNELLLFLSPLFPNIFSIEEHKRETIVPESMNESKIMKTHTPSVDINTLHQAKVLIEEVGLEWTALFLLSIAGLTLSLRSRGKMSSLENIQKDLIRKQEKIENEIKNLGVSGV